MSVLTIAVPTKTKTQRGNCFEGMKRWEDILLNYSQVHLEGKKKTGSNN